MIIPDEPTQKKFNQQKQVRKMVKQLAPFNEQLRKTAEQLRKSLEPMSKTFEKVLVNIDVLVQSVKSVQALLTYLKEKKRRAHDAYCSVRAKTQSVLRFPGTLAQVAQLFTTVTHSTSAPPGHTPALNVLATCHASNAPGLTPNAMNYWQVPTRE